MLLTGRGGEACGPATAEVRKQGPRVDSEVTCLHACSFPDTHRWGCFEVSPESQTATKQIDDRLFLWKILKATSAHVCPRAPAYQQHFETKPVFQVSLNTLLLNICHIDEKIKMTT